MYAELKKDDASLQNKSSDTHRDNKSQVNRHSDSLSGETTEGFTSSPSHALPPTGQGQLPMQFKGLSENPEPTQRGGQLIQRRVNNTGLPDNLKNGIENLSGYSMDDVKVHYNSSKPAQLRAHAYTQGTAIHVAPGQEQYLPHEAWHVVQQKQGRVKPTLQMKGKVNVNDDAGLEREADLMGARALKNQEPSTQTITVSNDNKEVIQGGWIFENFKSGGSHFLKRYGKFWEKGPREGETPMERINRRDTNRLQNSAAIALLIGFTALMLALFFPPALPFLAAAGGMVLSSYILYRGWRKHRDISSVQQQASSVQQRAQNLVQQPPITLEEPKESDEPEIVVQVPPNGVVNKLVESSADDGVTEKGVTEKVNNGGAPEKPLESLDSKLDSTKINVEQTTQKLVVEAVRKSSTADRKLQVRADSVTQEALRQSQNFTKGGSEIRIKKRSQESY